MFRDMSRRPARLPILVFIASAAIVVGWFDRVCVTAGVVAGEGQECRMASECMRSPCAASPCDAVPPAASPCDASPCDDPQDGSTQIPICPPGTPLMRCETFQRPLVRRWAAAVRIEQRALEPSAPVVGLVASPRATANLSHIALAHVIALPQLHPTTLLDLACLLVE
jgi:hypothetical protein